MMKEPREKEGVRGELVKDKRGAVPLSSAFSSDW